MSKRVFHTFEDFILNESFKQYVEGSNEKSVAYWKEWIAKHPECKDEIHRAVDVFITLSNHRKKEVDIDKNQSLKLLLSEIEKSTKRRFRSGSFSKIMIRIAAIIILSFGLSWIWNVLRTEHHISEEIVCNEIIVPTGEKSQIILSDGTHIWINSESRLKYPVTFNSESRNIILEGEAYFEVAEQNGSVFTVSTKDAKIEVLGTTFNVKSYPEDLKTQTTVISGLVKVVSKDKKIEPILIKPNQMAVVSETPKNKSVYLDDTPAELTVVDDVNTEVVTSWKDHLLVFEDETFEDIAVKMERWYNVKIIILDKELKQERYTGKFVHNETVYEVLDAIKITTPIAYSAKENVISITLE